MGCPTCKSITLFKGDTGETGATGATGADGTAATIAVGTVSALSAGATPTITNAGTTAAATFNFGIPAGATGSAGSAGADGKTILNGSGAPSGGADGDFWIDTANNRIYGPKASGTWPGSYTSIVGPTGSTGSTGSTGATGAAGAQGNQGVSGGYSSEWLYDTGTGTGTSSGDFRFDNATPGSVTGLYINNVNRDSANLRAWLDGFDNSNSFGVVKISKRTDSNVFWMGKVTAESDLGSEHDITVTYVANNGTFTNNDACVISFSPNGIDAGAPYLKFYTATMTQTGTDAPVATIPSAVSGASNYLGTIVWTRTGTGVYLGTLSGAFQNNVVCSINQGDVGTPVAAVLQLARTSDNTVTLRSFTASTGAATDVLLGTASIEIKQYA